MAIPKNRISSSTCTQCLSLPSNLCNLHPTLMSPSLRYLASQTRLSPLPFFSSALPSLLPAHHTSVHSARHFPLLSSHIDHKDPRACLLFSGQFIYQSQPSTYQPHPLLLVTIHLSFTHFPFTCNCVRREMALCPRTGTVAPRPLWPSRADGSGASQSTHSSAAMTLKVRTVDTTHKHVRKCVRMCMYIYNIICTPATVYNTYLNVMWQLDQSVSIF